LWARASQTAGAPRSRGLPQREQTPSYLTRHGARARGSVKAAPPVGAEILRVDRFLPTQGGSKEPRAVRRESAHSPALTPSMVPMIGLGGKSGWAMGESLFLGGRHQASQEARDVYGHLIRPKVLRTLIDQERLAFGGAPTGDLVDQVSGIAPGSEHEHRGERVEEWKPREVEARRRFGQSARPTRRTCTQLRAASVHGPMYWPTAPSTSTAIRSLSRHCPTGS
jgi:hypothetical protein